MIIIYIFWLAFVTCCKLAEFCEMFKIKKTVKDAKKSFIDIHPTFNCHGIEFVFLHCHFLFFECLLKEKGKLEEVKRCMKNCMWGSQNNTTNNNTHQTHEIPYMWRVYTLQVNTVCIGFVKFCVVSLVVEF